MKKLLTAAFIVMLMACICMGGALFVQAEVGDDAPCNHTGTLTVTAIDGDKHTLSCSACGYSATENCGGGTAADCQHLPNCAVCGDPYGSVYGAHTQNPVIGRHEDDPDHFHTFYYPCCDRTEERAHIKGAAATCQKATVCSVCQLQYGAKDYTNHVAGATKTPVPFAASNPMSATHHRIVCECGHDVSYEEHDYDNDCDADCADCGAIRTPAAHAFGEWQITKQPTDKAEGEQKRVCSVCGKEEKAVVSKLTADPEAPGGDPEPAGMKTSTIVIIIVAAVLVVAGAAVAVVFLLKKKKAKAQELPEAEVEAEVEAEAAEDTDTQE